VLEQGVHLGWEVVGGFEQVGWRVQIVCLGVSTLILLPLAACCLKLGSRACSCWGNYFLMKNCSCFVGSSNFFWL
jgi:hypothetical protein